MFRFNCRLCAIVICATSVLVAPVTASPLPADVEVTEMMMEAMGAEVQGVARTFGIDETASLDFTTVTDPGNLEFSFALDAGTVYNGQALDILGAGNYNAALSRWEGCAVVASGSGESLVSTWTSDVLSTDPYEADLDWVGENMSRAIGPDYHGNWRVNEKPPGSGRYTSFISGILTWRGSIVGTFYAEDSVDIPGRAWTFDGGYLVDAGQGDDFAVSGDGTLAYGGGLAWASYVIVPEPASIIVLALPLLGFRRRQW
ncbi:MAG: hypothetical protein JXO22_03085 [Phycisphaerae bacterium]|nr:hypothetical protein [Phycisphaerae bacterium]